MGVTSDPRPVTRVELTTAGMAYIGDHGEYPAYRKPEPTSQLLAGWIRGYMGPLEETDGPVELQKKLAEALVAAERAGLIVQGPGMLALALTGGGCCGGFGGTVASAEARGEFARSRS